MRPAFALVLAAAVFMLLWQSGTATTTAAPASCGLTAPAFCDTLSQPTTNGPDIRSGQLDGVVWGVSRATTADAVFQGGYTTWFAANATICGSTSSFNSPNDVRICNGQLFETVKDGGAATTWSAYPRQPFDIAGRTGTVAFDLTADGLCNHCAWPGFEYTDQPVPGPSSFGPNMPRNGFGFTLYQVGVCPTGQTGVGDMSITQSYKNISVNVSRVGCVIAGTAGGPLNHFEVRMSPTHVEVWGSDPGGANFKQLAFADVQMPLTRGLVWMIDQHYNAAKEAPPGTTGQQTHTFAWANFGFDGPIIARDLGFDVKDFESGNSTDQRLGYLCYWTCTIKLNNVSNIAAATGALLEFTWTPHNVESLIITVNGHSYTFAWPYADTQTYAPRTIAVPVNPTDLVAGTNTLTITTPNSVDIFDVANLDLILVAAGGIPSPPIPGPSPTAVPTLPATATPSNTPTMAPVATSTPTPVPTATNTPVVPTATPTDTPPPTPTATSTPQATPTATDTPLAMATATPTDTPTPTGTPQATPTDTPVPAATLTPTSTPTTVSTPGSSLTQMLLPGDNLLVICKGGNGDITATLHGGTAQIACN